MRLFFFILKKKLRNLQICNKYKIVFIGWWLFVDIVAPMRAQLLENMNDRLVLDAFMNDTRWLSWQLHNVTMDM